MNYEIDGFNNELSHTHCTVETQGDETGTAEIRPKGLVNFHTHP